MATKPTFANIAAKAIASRPVAKPPPPQIQIIAKPAGDTTPLEVAAAAKTPTDDTSTHVSSSESSVKLPSFDKQSVASGTTFAMDEKESLRPDDSASLRAVNEDEDGTTAESRGGSDTDARAFSDQLHRIQQIGTGAPRAILQPGSRPQIQFGQMPMPIQTAPETPNVEVSEQLNPVSVAPDMPPVDEKLLDALASPRDRVFILKIEQDILDFMKNESEAHLTLPDCNSFYRMLSHRLADYYGLDHTHHPRDSGTAVLISKTPHSRVPPPLANLPIAGAENSSPPPEMTTRKIMRRGDTSEGMSGPSTTANSEGPSKATSEIGESGSGRIKDKSNMTREEREKLYAEARLRIMGKAEPDPEEAAKPVDNDLSRSSSASGKRKAKKRKDDDDFEPRSQFPGYNGPQSYGYPGYGDGTFYFPQYTGGVMSAPQQQYPMAPTSTASPPPVAYSGYMGAEQSSQMQYMTPQPYSAQPTSTMNPQPYLQPSNGQYDLSAQFSNMNFMSPTQQGLPPKPNASPNFASGPAPSAQQGWNAPSYDNQQFMYGQQTMFVPYQVNSVQTPATIPYAYGQLPNPALQGGKMQHPLPGSFNRQQFNPQTQAFVPGGAGRGAPMPMHVQGSPFYGQWSMNPNATMQPFRASSGPPAGAQHRPPPVKSTTNAYPSPAMPQPVQAYMNTPTMHFQSMASAGPHNPTQTQPQGQNHTDATPQQQRPVLSPGATATLAHPLPQPPNPESSIAKWGTPSHLPPKPPTPANPHPTKFVDINKGMPRGVVTGLPAYRGGNGSGST